MPQIGGIDYPGGTQSPDGVAPYYYQPDNPIFRKPPRSPDSSNNGCIIALGFFVLMVILGLVFSFSGAYQANQLGESIGNATTAAAHITLFCTDYETQDYGSAYQLLSSSAQGSQSQAQYATHAQALDASDGTVDTCTMDANHPLPTLSGDGKTATAQVQVARGENANLTTGTIKLVYENDQWKIDSADSSLKLF